MSDHPDTPSVPPAPADPADALLTAALGDDPPPFAILHRPHVTGPDTAELLTGELVGADRLAGLPLPTGIPGDPAGSDDLLAVVPFRQIGERGFDHVDDGAPLLALRVAARAELPLTRLLDRLPSGPAGFTATGYDVPDAAYEATVRAVLAHEIGRGAGSNFVIHRSLLGRVDRPPVLAALAALRRLLLSERHAYWTFVVHTGRRTFVGATPERHVSLDAGLVAMNPISGTLRYPAAGWADDAQRRAATLAFLEDPKERDELAMVVDEELKMMAVVADGGGRVRGPYLKEMSRLAHTEYVLEGRTSLDVRDVLAATMFAPTVTGSPIRNACRVIARHERRGRGYYGGVLALIGRDATGAQRLDAPIMIRTAWIDAGGDVRVPAGATLVRGSVPEAELAETRAKAAGIVAALGDGPVPAAVSAPRAPATDDPLVAKTLTARNDLLAGFWLHDQPPRPAVASGTPGVVVVEAEDDFTAMFAHLLRSLGLGVRVLPWPATGPGGPLGDVAERSGVVVVGPGPGDPRDAADPRVGALRRITRTRLATGRPTLAVCLGHQLAAAALGMRVEPLRVPNQGVQERIHLFGSRQTVGFYNSFVARVPRAVPAETAVAADPLDGRVHAIRRAGLATLQFHPESVLTTDGIGILRRELVRLLA